MLHMNKKSKKTKYNNIKSEERMQIIKYFTDNQLTASQISQLTRHNLSTIKAIYRVFKKEGRINKKDKRDRLLNIVKNFAVAVVDDEQLNVKARVKGMKFFTKKQLKKQLTLRNSEKINDVFDDSEQKTILDVLKSSACSMKNDLDNFQAQNDFEQMIKSIQKNGITINDFTSLNSQTVFRNNLEWKRIQQLFDNQQEQDLSRDKSLHSFIPCKSFVDIGLELDSIKSTFEKQIQFIKAQAQYQK